jgi:K+-transporting ATPase ATPase A chain
MTFSSVLLLGAYLVVIVGLGYPLGLYMARLYDGTSPVLGWLAPLERLLYRAAGVREDEDMPWPRYALAVLLFNVLGVLVVYGLERAQGSLPLNPAGLGAVSPEVSFNTAVSFASNTNWQAYGGETTLSYLTQMLALTVQNFVSAATGMAVLVALIRGFSRKNAQGIGSFWVDLVRSTLYVLLPLSCRRVSCRRSARTRPCPCSTPRRARTGLRSPISSSRSGQPPRRSRSSSSARTAAGSST